MPANRRCVVQRTPTQFSHYIGIDYSGAATPTTGLKGLRVYMAGGDDPPLEVLPPPGRKKHWTRRGVAEWLTLRLAESTPTLVGIDHGFCFPLRYFEAHGLDLDWPAFLDDFCRHWPTDGDKTRVDDVRRGRCGNGAARQGSSRWRRLAETRTGRAKSVFHFDVPGSVAKSTHAGLPWLRFLRERLGDAIHCWPFDGWTPPPGRSVLAEAYPSLWRHGYPREGRTDDQQDAFAAAAWMRRTDRAGHLNEFLNPPMTAAERAVADVEGWILGVR